MGVSGGQTPLYSVQIAGICRSVRSAADTGGDGGV